jgi:nucleotide-binding universal stress UspA family protein
VETLKDGIKVLVAYDGSEYARKAVSEAADIAKKFGGIVTVLHVFWDPAQIAREDEVAAVEGIDVRDQPSISVLDDVEPVLKKIDVNYELRSVRSNHPPSVILDIAEKEGYDLISMGCRGLGGAKAWLLGSVSQKVVSEANCPVLVIK